MAVPYITLYNTSNLRITGVAIYSNVKFLCLNSITAHQSIIEIIPNDTCNTFLKFPFKVNYLELKNKKRKKGNEHDSCAIITWIMVT